MLGAKDGALTMAAPNETHRAKCEQHRGDVEAAIVRVVGVPVRVVLVVEHAPVHDEDARGTNPPPGQPAESFITPDDDIDPHDLVDAHDLLDAPVDSPIERFARHFPGSELMEEPR